MSIIDDHKEEFNKTLEHFKNELGGIRTGRANPALIENVIINAYGNKMPINQLANINVADAKSMTVEPWDKNLLKDVEKAISEANLGLTAANEGNFIRVKVPEMTEESRKNLVKLLKEKTEDTRISIRNTRDKVKEEISKQEKNKEITEDDKYKLQKELDEVTNNYNEQIKELAQHKEEKIMSV